MLVKTTHGNRLGASAPPILTARRRRLLYRHGRRADDEDIVRKAHGHGAVPAAVRRLGDRGAEEARYDDADDDDQDGEGDARRPLQNALPHEHIDGRLVFARVRFEVYS